VNSPHTGHYAAIKAKHPHNRYEAGRAAEKLANACSTVEERRFQRRVKRSKSVRASAFVVVLSRHMEFFSNLLGNYP
jgi:hypothetical protein